ncbi:TetR/AcrR family transcriptional regulator [Streptacidiphilus fuscans]|uniref:TetR/AcrR family transcriptional regulator n=1 Tax=Streptacidiphilus fuscans TaxID=2789292 RepID=A0A931FCB1_9ACTN|nr:TetR/AcrR family transcriptional regulator [Streptacidiphilus fuscans]MBF9066995.1 TetR/AcrR family transcriptional regulator [Streptacidiphilus fuscans]
MTPASDTRIRLIEVAEQLFAERGIHAVSLRQIAAAAGQRNTSAVAYHFGTKQALVEAVYQHRMAPTSERQLRQLERLDAQGWGKDLRALVELLVRSMAERLDDPERPSRFLRFVVNALYVEEIAPFDLAAQEWTQGIALIRTRIEEGMSALALSREVRANRWEFFVGLVLHTLAQRERLLETRAGTSAAGRELPGQSRLVADLVDSAVAVLTAEVSS